MRRLIRHYAALGAELIWPQRTKFVQLREPAKIEAAYDFFMSIYQKRGVITYDGDAKKAIKKDVFHAASDYYALVDAQGSFLVVGRLIAGAQYDLSQRTHPIEPSNVTEISMLGKRPGAASFYVALFTGFLAEMALAQGKTTLTMAINERAHAAGVTQTYGPFLIRAAEKPIVVIKHKQEIVTHVYDFALRQYARPSWRDGLWMAVGAWTMRWLVRRKG